MDYSEIFNWIDLIDDNCIDADGQFEPYNVDPNIYYFVAEAFRDLLSLDTAPPNLRCANPLGLTVQAGTDSATIAKRLMLYSDRPVVFVEEDFLDTYPNGGWGYSEPQTPEEEKREYRLEQQARQAGAEWEKRRRRQIQDPFFEEYDEVVPSHLIEWLYRLRPLIADGRITILPTHHLAGGGGDEPLGLVDYRFQGLRAQLGGDVLGQLTEHFPSGQSVGIRMPYLRHIPLEDFVAFRDENGLEFEGLHRELRNMVHGLSNATAGHAEEALVEIIEKVDYAVRKLDDVYREKRRKSAVLSVYDLAYLSAGLILYGTLPEDVSRVLVTILGSATIKNVTDRVASMRDTNRDSPFYAAWRTHRRFPQREE